MNNDDNLYEDVLEEWEKDIAHDKALAINEAINHLEAAYKLMKTMPTKGRATYLLAGALHTMKGNQDEKRTA